jgi:predicted translin family RNA/ssDNA-binding protein
MLQRDYILRMIEMIGELIAGVLGLIKKKDYQKASNTLDQAYYNFLKEDAAFFRNIPTEKLTKNLLQEHDYSYGHLEILSELFYAQAELFKAEGKADEAREYYEKSLILLEFVMKEEKVFSLEREKRINLLKEKYKGG